MATVSVMQVSNDLSVKLVCRYHYYRSSKQIRRSQWEFLDSDAGKFMWFVSNVRKGFAKYCNSSCACLRDLCSHHVPTSVTIRMNPWSLDDHHGLADSSGWPSRIDGFIRMSADSIRIGEFIRISTDSIRIVVWIADSRVKKNFFYSNYCKY